MMRARRCAPAPPALLLSLAFGAAGAARRRLVEADVDYGLRAYNATYRTRAHTLFSSDAHFRSRLFEHESALPEDELASFHVSLAPGVKSCNALRHSLEGRARLVLDGQLIGDDLMAHGTREHADALRALPEVRKVVAALPELKLTPHWDTLVPNATTATLLVTIVPYDRHEHLRGPTAEVAAAATKALRAACAEDGGPLRKSCAASPPLELVPEGDKLMALMRAPTAEIEAIAAVLSRVPGVVWIEPKPTYRHHNQGGTRIMQSGSNPVGGGAGSTVVGATPIWDMGITGEDQIVGVGDSGLDTDHCFFDDPGEPFGPNHRKVRCSAGPLGGIEACDLGDGGARSRLSPLDTTPPSISPPPRRRGCIAASQSKKSYTALDTFSMPRQTKLALC